MANHHIAAGTAEPTITVTLRQNSTGTSPGDGLTGITYSGVTMYYTLVYSDGTTTGPTAVTVVAGTLHTFNTDTPASKSSWVLLDNTSSPGDYQLCLPTNCCKVNTPAITECKISIKVTGAINAKETIIVGPINANAAKVGGTAQTGGDLATLIAAIPTTTVWGNHTLDVDAKTIKVNGSTVYLPTADYGAKSGPPKLDSTGLFVAAYDGKAHAGTELATISGYAVSTGAAITFYPSVGVRGAPGEENGPTELGPLGVWRDSTGVTTLVGLTNGSTAWNPASISVNKTTVHMPFSAYGGKGGVPVLDATGLFLLAADGKSTLGYDTTTITGQDPSDFIGTAVWTKPTSELTVSGSVGKWFSTLFAGITSVGQWLGALFGKQTPNSTAQTEIRATGAGSGTFDATTDSVQAIRDRGDAAWVTGGSGSAPTTSEIRQYLFSTDNKLVVSSSGEVTTSNPATTSGLSGSTAVTLTVKDALGVGIQNAVITINSLPIYSGSGGVTAFSLNPGTYTAYVTAPTCLFSPFTFTVASSAYTSDITGTAMPSPADSVMSLSQARAWVRDMARNANDSTMYTNSQIDRAIMFAGNEWEKETRYLRSTANVTVTISSASVTMPSGFFPENLLSAWFDKHQVTPISDSDMQVLQALTPQTNPPKKISFPTKTTGTLYPTPSASGTLKIFYTLPFPMWTAGQSDDTISMQLPTMYMQYVVGLGAPAILQTPEPEHAYSSEAWKRFEAQMARCKLPSSGQEVTKACRGR